MEAVGKGAERALPGLKPTQTLARPRRISFNDGRDWIMSFFL